MLATGYPLPYHDAQSHSLPTEEVRFRLQQVCVDAAILVDRLQRPRRYFHLYKFLQCVGEEALVLDVGQPGAPRFLHREGNIVAVLLHLAMEETKLGALEGRADNFFEGRRGREHGSR